MVIYHLWFHKPYNMYSSYKCPTKALGPTIVLKKRAPKTNHTIKPRVLWTKTDFNSEFYMLYPLLQMLYEH